MFRRNGRPIVDVRNSWNEASACLLVEFRHRGVDADYVREPATVSDQKLLLQQLIDLRSRGSTATQSGSCASAALAAQDDFRLVLDAPPEAA